MDFLPQYSIWSPTGVLPHFLLQRASATADDNAILLAMNLQNSDGPQCVKDNCGRKITAGTAGMQGGCAKEGTAKAEPHNIYNPRLHRHTIPLTQNTAHEYQRRPAAVCSYAFEGAKTKSPQQPHSPLSSLVPILSGFLCESHISLDNDRFV